MELVITLLVYAAISSAAAGAGFISDCAKFGEITEQETRYEASTCFVKRGQKWIPAAKAEYPQ